MREQPNASMRRRGRQLCLALAAFTASAAPAAFAQVVTNHHWGSSSGLWSEPLHWSTLSVPDALNEAAFISASAANPYTVTLDASVAINALELSSFNGNLVIGSASELTPVTLSVGSLKLLRGGLHLGGTLRVEGGLTSIDSFSMSGPGAIQLMGGRVTYARAVQQGTSVLMLRSGWLGSGFGPNVLHAGHTLRVRASNESAAAQDVTLTSLTSNERMIIAGTLVLESADGNYAARVDASDRSPLENRGTFLVKPGPTADGPRTVRATVFENTAGATATFDASTQIIGGLSNSGTINIAAGKTLTAGRTGLDGAVTQKAGTLNISGDLIVNSLVTFTYEGGQVTGNPVRLAGANLTFAPGLLSASGRYLMSGSGTLKGPIPQGAAVIILGQGPASGANVGGGLINSGTLTLDAASARVQLNFSPSGVLTNRGVFRTIGGTSSLNSGSFLNEPGGQASFEAGFQVPGLFTNHGNVSVAAGKQVTMVGFAQNAGVLDVQGSLTVDGGDFNYNGGQVVGSPVVLRSGAGLRTNAPSAGGTFAFENGGFIRQTEPGRAPIRPAQTVVVRSWSLTGEFGFTNYGTLILDDLGPSGIRLAVQGSGPGLSDGVFTNAGRLDVESPGGRIERPIVNTPEGVVVVKHGAFLTFDHAFNNQGTAVFEEGANSATFRAGIENSGTLTFVSGNLITVGPGSGPVLIRNSGVLRLKPRVQINLESESGLVVNSGTLEIEPQARIHLGQNVSLLERAHDLASREQSTAYLNELIASNRLEPGAVGLEVTGLPSNGRNLAVIPNDRGDGIPLLTSIQGTEVGPNDVIVKLAPPGDLDLSGTVGADDYSRMDRGFLSRADGSPGNDLSGYHNGDLNYDGAVNISDYFLIDRSLARQVATLAAAAVPEPAVGGVLSLVCLVLGRRRLCR